MTKPPKKQKLRATPKETHPPYDLSAFGAHFEKYTKLREVDMSPRSIQTMKDTHKAFWKFLGSTGFKGDELAVSREDILRYAEYVFKRKDLKRNTAINYIRFLNSFYLEAVKQGWLGENPYRGIELPKEEKILINVVSVKEMKEILECPQLNSVEGQMARTVMELMYSCALRRDELLSLTAQNFSEDCRTLTFIRKGQKEVSLPVGKVAAHFVRHWIEQVWPKLNQGHEPELFLSLKTKKKMDKQTLWALISKYAKQILPERDLGTHFFRYSACSHLADEGVDIRILQEYMSHEKTYTTMKYIQQSFQKLQEVFRKTHPRS